MKNNRCGWVLGFCVALSLLLSPGICRAVDAANSDPITGQAGWYDVRVRISRVGADETAAGVQNTSPQFEPMKPYPGMKARSSILAFLGVKPK